MERKLNFRRKSEKILREVISPTVLYESTLRVKLVAGKFPTTKTGLCKLSGLLILLATLSMFLVYPVCTETSDWYPYLFPLCIGITVFVQLFFYIFFSCGYLRFTKPYKWMKADAISVFLLSILSVIASVLTNFDCNHKERMHHIQVILGIVGSVILIFSCPGLLLMYRIDDEEKPTEKPDLTPQISRISVHV